jgi:FHA domain
MEMTWRQCPKCVHGAMRRATARSQAEATIVRRPESEAPDRTRIMTREEALAEAATVRLIGVSGPMANQDVAISPGTLCIGKAPATVAGQRQVVISDDGFLSRDHASIEFTGASLVLQDAGSTNGCYVNGTRVQRSNLRHGDQIQLGQSVFRLDWPA